MVKVSIQLPGSAWFPLLSQLLQRLMNLTIINEDSVREKNEIPYYDKNEDIAKICEVIDYGSLLSDSAPTCECIAGSCFAYLSPNENIHGGHL